MFAKGFKGKLTKLDCNRLFPFYLRMKTRNNIKFGIALIVLLFAVQTSYAQKLPVKPKKVNFSYSKNPPTKSPKSNSKKKKEPAKNVVGDKKASNAKAKLTDLKKKRSGIEEPLGKGAEGIIYGYGGIKKPVVEGQPENLSIAKKTREIVKKAAKEKLLPTEIYKVGAEDVLFISLQNSASVSSKYYTVLNDGSIDYPLAGELLTVIGLTTDEIEELLREKIKLYKNPQVTVKIREYASHKITLLGLVEKPGDKFLQREAMPLYVIRAQALPKPNATKVSIKRKNSNVETYNLAKEKYEKILVYPGDIVEFKGLEAGRQFSGNQYYYIGELVRQFGRKDFYEGLTLTQAILECGGLRNSKVNRVVIRRKDSKGLLISKVVSLRDIKKGKIPDPILAAGDTIEVSN